MSKPVTCCLCGNQVDDFDTVQMPNGLMCLDPCYIWLEAMMEQDGEDDDDEDGDVVYVFTWEEEELEDDEE